MIFDQFCAYTQMVVAPRPVERTKCVLENTIRIDMKCTTLPPCFFTFKGALETFHSFRTVKPFRLLALPL